MDRAALKGTGFWKHLKVAYGNDLPNYQERITAIIDICRRESPDIVIFPACTGLWRYHAQLERYRREMRRLPCVAFGALRIGQAKLREHSEIWVRGRPVSRFDSRWPIAIRLAGRAAVVAQSSTIKAAYQAPYLTLPAEHHAANPPYRLAISIGHGQYQGRFRRSLRRLNKMGADVILSFWRNREGQTNYPWIEAAGFTHQRRILKAGDYLDLITLGRTKF
jgi:hypothetical protein